MPKIKLSKIGKVIKFIKKVFKPKKDPKSAYTKDI